MKQRNTAKRRITRQQSIIRYLHDLLLVVVSIIIPLLFMPTI